MSSGNEIYDQFVESFSKMFEPRKNVEYALSVDADIAKLDEADTLDDDPSELEAQLNASTESITNLLGEKCNEPSFNIKDPTLIKQLMQRSWVDTLDSVREMRESLTQELPQIQKSQRTLFDELKKVRFPLPTNRKIEHCYRLSRYLAKRYPDITQYDADEMGVEIPKLILEEAKSIFRIAIEPRAPIDKLHQHVGGIAACVRVMGTGEKVDPTKYAETVVNSLYAFTHGALAESEYRDAIAFNIARTIASYNSADNLNVDIKNIFNIANFMECFAEIKTDLSNTRYIEIPNSYTGEQVVIRTDQRLENDSLPIEVVERRRGWIYVCMSSVNVADVPEPECSYDLLRSLPAPNIPEKVYRNVINDLDHICERSSEVLNARFSTIAECIDAVVSNYTDLVTNQERLDKLNYLERRSISYLMGHLLAEVILPIAEYYVTTHRHLTYLSRLLHDLTRNTADSAEATPIAG